LDVGCGEGFTLSFFKNLNWEVKGFDFNSHGLEAQNPDCLGYIVTGDIFSLLESEISSNQKYEIIWLQNVLEHVLEPISLLKKLHVLMSPNGITVISVPNDFSTLQQKALEHGHINQKFWVALPDHLSYFNYNSLFKVVEATGWNCLEILADFPIDWFLFNPHTNYIRDKNVGKAAHSTRVELENLIHTQSADKVNIFYAALARLGFGRNLTAFIEIPKKMRTK
jgi:2-polyprenyl-3-methyl-5-hydroxy-6-metoxy-1,4-benzoquinol methylase